MNELENALKAVKTAKLDLEIGEAKLYRQDGSKLYSDDEHNQRMNELTSKVTENVKRVNELSRETRAEIAAEREALKAADPIASLTTEELQRAYYLRPFVAEQFGDKKAFPDQLGKTLASIARSDDKAARVVFEMYADKRVREDKTKQNSREYSAGLRALREANIDPTIEKKMADFENRLNAASQAAIEANRIGTSVRGFKDMPKLVSF